MLGSITPDGATTSRRTEPTLRSPGRTHSHHGCPQCTAELGLASLRHQEPTNPPLSSAFTEMALGLVCNRNPGEAKGPQETWGKMFCWDPTRSIFPLD